MCPCAFPQSFKKKKKDLGSFNPCLDGNIPAALPNCNKCMQTKQPKALSISNENLNSNCANHGHL